MSPGLEEVWREREEDIYPTLFGSAADGIYVLSSDLFTGAFRQESVDPRWLHYGVQVFSPTQKRPSWMYVSSGLSNPWELEPDQYSQSEYSGFGTELVFETAGRSDWAVRLIQRILAFNILLAHGRYPNGSPLDYGDRIPLRGSIDFDGDSEVRNLVVGVPRHYDQTFRLASGSVDLLHLVGATDREISFAKEHGSDRLLEKLSAAGYFPVTDPARNSVDDV